MSSSEIKKQLDNDINLIADEDGLMILTEAAEAYVTNLPYFNQQRTPEQSERLDESIKQAKEGNFISHEEVLKRSKEWYKKGIK